MKVRKKIWVILIIIFLLTLNYIDVYATDIIMEGADKFLDAGRDTTLKTDKVKEVSSSIFNIFAICGTIIVFAVGIIIAMQFIIGSAEEKAKVKETLIPYVIGSGIIFGAFTIWRILILVMDEIF